MYLVFLMVTSGFIGLFVFEGIMDECVVEAATIIVDGNGGGDYATIQDAINNATTGDIIYVWSGTYYENVIINQTISLVGNGSSETTIDGSGNSDVVVITKNWVNMLGFTITGSGSLIGNAGLKLENVMNCYVAKTNCTNNHIGLHINDSTDNRFFNNICLGNNNDGMYINFSLRNSIINTTCTSNGDDGIHLNCSSRNDIINLTSRNNFHNGIRLESSLFNEIMDGTCVNNGVDGVNIYDSSINDIVNTTCSNNQQGIYLFWYSSLNSFDNCSFYSNTNKDFYLSQNCNNNIAINTTFDTIYFYDSTSKLIIKNYLHVRTYNNMGSPISGIDVKVTDDSKTTYATLNFSGSDPKTNAVGEINWILVTDRIYDGNIVATENSTIVTIKSIDKVIIDNDRNVDMFTSHVEEFYLNLIPDRVNIKSPPDNSYVNETEPELIWHAGHDADSESLTYYVQLDESSDNWGTLLASTHTPPRALSWKVPISLEDGNKYQWRICANDGLSNSSWSNISRFTLDTDVPVADQPYSHSTINNTGAVIWHWEPSDNTGSGILGYYVTITEDTDDTVVVQDIWTTNIWFEKTELEDSQTYYCKIKAKNGAGIIGSYSKKSQGVEVDINAPPPPLSLTITPNNWTSNNLFEIYWTDPEDFSGVKKGVYYYVSKSPPTSQSNGIWVSEKPFSITNAKEGISNIYLWLEDKFGNTNYMNYGAVTLKLDMTPPSITHTKVKKGSAGVPIEITATVFDGLTGIDSVRLYYQRASDSTYTSSLMKDNDDTYSATIPDGFVISEGLSYYIEVADKSKPPNMNYYGFGGETENKPTISTDIDIVISPIVLEKSPFGTNVTVDSTISILFSKQMNRNITEKSFVIYPPMTGIFAWKEKQLLFMPDTFLSYNITYTVTILRSAKDLSENTLEQDFTWSFTIEDKLDGNGPDENIPDSSSTEDSDKKEDDQLTFYIILSVLIIIVALVIVFLFFRKKKRAGSGSPVEPDKPVTMVASAPSVLSTPSATSVPSAPSAPYEPFASSEPPRQPPSTSSTPLVSTTSQPIYPAAYSYSPPFRCERCGASIMAQDRCPYCGWVREQVGRY